MALRKRDNQLPVILCFIMASVCQNIQAECDGDPPTLNVEYKEQNLFSPGYPRHYSNNMDCMWILQAASNRSAGFGIQVVTIELELDPDYETTTVGQCNSDYLELFEGIPSKLGPRVGIWCGTDRKALTSPSSVVTLKFHSNNRHTGKGFLIEYALVKLASTKCHPGNITEIYTGRAPLYVSFTVNNIESRCTWRIEAIDNYGVADSDSILVVEAFSIPKIWCRDGEVALYDGPDTSSPKVLHWCNGGEAFSEIFMSSNLATITFKSFNGSQRFQSDTMQLKLYTQSRRFVQVCSESVTPEIHVNKNPVYFHLPITDVKGNHCPVTVSQRTENNFLRIDVMSVNGHLPTCESDVITVKRALGDRGQLEKSCNRHQFPVYLPLVAAAIVSSTERVLVRAVSADPFCSGVGFTKLATTSLLFEDVVPKGFMQGTQTHNCIGKYLITTGNQNLSVALKLEWTIPQEQKLHFTDSDVCIGDYLNVYDGRNESSPLLFSTCHKADWPNFFVERRIIGKSANMLILFNSDDVADSNLVKVYFYAVPKNTDCSEPQTVTVTTDVHELTSPNYPGFYPLDYDCTYKLTAKSPEDIIVIEVLDSQFSVKIGCENVIYIYNGDTGILVKDYLGHICGHDKDKKFISNQHQVLIRFQSDEIGLSGRWRMKIYSQGRSTAGISHIRGADLICLLLTSLLIVF